MNKSMHLIQLAVGLFFILGMSILAYFTIILSSNNIFGQNNLYSIIFKDIGGLKKGNTVSLHGVPIGKVEKIKIDGKNHDKVLVIINLREKFLFHSDYKISVKNGSVLGGQYLDIKLGSSDNLTLDKPLKGDLPINIISKIVGVITEIEESDILGNIKIFTKELANITTKISDGKVIEKVNLVIDNFERFSNLSSQLIDNLLTGKGSLGKLIIEDDFYNDLVDILRNGKETFSNTNDIIINLKKGKGSLGKLLIDDKAYVTFTTALAEIKKTFNGTSIFIDGLNKKIEGNKGSLAKLINDDNLYDNLNKSFEGANAVIEDLREQAPIQTFGSLIFNAL